MGMILTTCFTDNGFTKTATLNYGSAKEMFALTKYVIV